MTFKARVYENVAGTFVAKSCGRTVNAGHVAGRFMLQEKQIDLFHVYLLQELVCIPKRIKIFI